MSIFAIEPGNLCQQPGKGLLGDEMGMVRIGRILAQPFAGPGERRNRWFDGLGGNQVVEHQRHGSVCEVVTTVVDEEEG